MRPRVRGLLLGILTCEVSAQAVPYADALKEKVKLQTILEARYNHDELTAAIVSDGLRPTCQRPRRRRSSR